MSHLVRVAGLGLLAVTLACTGDSQSRNGGRTVAERATLTTPHRTPTRSVAPGAHDLTAEGIPALLFVPRSYRAATPAPLIVLLHGAGQRADEWTQAPLLALFDAQDAVIVSVNSVGQTWDFLQGGFGPDVVRIDTVLAAVLDRVNVDSTRVALGGFSDGASYALSLGVANGERFSALLAFAPGFMDQALQRGKPRIYMAHGTNDQVLPIGQTSRILWGLLQTAGYDVTYKEFAGRHGIYVNIVDEALKWFAASPRGDSPRPDRSP